MNRSKDWKTKSIQIYKQQIRQLTAILHRPIKKFQNYNPTSIFSSSILKAKSVT